MTDSNIPAPTTVVVGPHEVKIVFVEDGVMGDGGRHGQCSINRLVVAIDGELPATLMGETVLHEIGHFLLASVGITDEDVVERLALRFGVDVMALIRDNPDLVKWVQSL
jgi:hypothetical protein